MFPTWGDFYFLKTFKRHITFAKICKSVVLKKVFRLRFRYAVTREKGVGFGTGEKGVVAKPEVLLHPLFFCTCGTPIKSDLSNMSDMSDKVPHQTLMQNQSVYQY